MEASTMSPLNPNDFIISRKRKKYRFALFHNSPLCYEMSEWNTTWSPTQLEIGAGTGYFSVELAKRYPERHIVAADVKGDRLQQGARRAESEKLGNIRFLRVRADQLTQLIKPQSLEVIWVTFPDPFPRKHSAGRRLMHPHFLTIYQQLLAKTGALYFKTDARDLFTWSLEQLVGAGWRIDKLTFDLHNSSLMDEYKIMTTYEARFMAEALPIHFVKALPPRV